MVHLYSGIDGDSARQVDAITCTPEHLSITDKIDDLVRSEGSYLDLSSETTTVTSGTGKHTHSLIFLRDEKPETGRTDSTFR